MRAIRYPESFLVEQLEEPVCLLLYAGLADEASIQRFAQESPQAGTILYSGIGDASPGATHWNRAAQALSVVTGIIVSDHQASIFHAGMRLNDPGFVLVGEFPSGLRWFAESSIPGMQMEEATIKLEEFLDHFESLSR